jgi:hypothetical protein
MGSLEVVLPLAHRSEHSEFAGVAQAALLQGADDFGLRAAQEGVGGFFQCDGGGQGDLVCCAQLPGGGDALLQHGIIRFAGQREAQVGCGVFVGAIHAGVVGQQGQALQGMVQLCRCPFEVPAAACAEQHVAAEQNIRCDEADVIVKVAGDLDDAELYAGRGQLESVTFAQIVGDVRIVGMSPPIHRHVVYFAQFCNTADMVIVAMGAQDSVQLQVVRMQEAQYRRSFARVDHGSMPVVVDGPDVVVLQGWDSGDFKYGAGRH